MHHSDEEQQKQHFNQATHQYPRDAILNPPLHTELELKQVLDRLKGVPIDGPVMDFGAGTGRLSVALAKAGYDVLSVDISEPSLHRLRFVADELQLPSIRTSLTYAEHAPFSAIVGADILHHIDMDEHLPRLYAALRKGGKVVFTEPGAWNPTWYILLFNQMDIERRIVHNNLITLRRKFRRYGFVNVRIAGLGLVPRPFFNWMRAACELHDASGNLALARWFAYRYIIEASK